LQRFCLQFRGYEFFLNNNEALVGRSSACTIVINDPRVSRRHARFYVERSQLVVEDLGSRNGTIVNDVTIRQTIVLSHHDVVCVGGSEIRIEAALDTAARAAAAIAEEVQDPFYTSCEGDTEIWGVDPLFSMLENALAVGVLDEAREVLKRLFSEMFRGRTHSPNAMERTAHLTLHYAHAAKDGAVLDQLFVLFRTLRHVMPAPLVEEARLFSVRTSHPISEVLRTYVEWLRSETPRLNPQEKFSLYRAETVLRSLRGA
jgi:predicted component of type VI protein secretion system